MAELRTKELSGIIGSLPDVTPFNPTSCVTQELFICALGFEPRCLAIPSRLAAAGSKFGKVLILQFATNQNENEVNRSALNQALETLSPDIEVLNADTQAFGLALQEVLEHVRARTEVEVPRVAVDISVFANRFVMRTLHGLIKSDISLRILYSEAESYFPTEDEYRKDPAQWRLESMLGLERGVSQVTTSFEHPGHHLDPLPDRVILFPTFKIERSMAVVTAVDPSILMAPAAKIIWIIGVPHLAINRWRVDAVREINGITANSLSYEVSTFDYKNTLAVLNTIHTRDAEQYKLTISPLGSKLQAVGTSLFCYMKPDVRVMFAIPKEYNAAHYSIGAAALWQIEFANTNSLRNLLDSVGQLCIAT